MVMGRCLRLARHNSSFGLLFVLFLMTLVTTEAKRGGGGGSRGGSSGGSRGGSSGGSRGNSGGKSSGSSWGGSSGSDGGSSGGGWSLFGKSSSSSGTKSSSGGWSIFGTKSGTKYSTGSVFTSANRYTYSSPVRVTNYGRPAVPYRSIRPTYGSSYVVPVIYSPVRYRPIFLPSYYYYWPSMYHHHHYYGYYRNRYYDRNRYYRPGESTPTPSDDNPPMQAIFANLADHCNIPEYGIDGQEEYFISALAPNVSSKPADGGFDSGSDLPDPNRSTSTTASTTAQPILFTPSCNFDIAGPETSVLKITFNSTRCYKTWPAECEIGISDVVPNEALWDDESFDPYLLRLDAKSNLAALANGSEICTKEIYSRFNKIAINIAHCSGNLDTFDYAIGVEVAVLVDEGGFSIYRPPTSFSRLLIIFVLVSMIANSNFPTFSYKMSSSS